MTHKESVSITQSKTRAIAYWITTVLVVSETAVGAQWDLVRNPYVTKEFIDLGYPLYLLTILGIWKIPAAIILIIPRFPLVKEWAYAGLFFVYTGAVASHFFMKQTSAVIGPGIFACMLIASWYLRPPSRRIGRKAS
ncbi:MAG TPA: DoxX family protein [Puia sp.]|jgi:hypothetical protein|nr:DoxX family protein [Puia sp.]